MISIIVIVGKWHQKVMIKEEHVHSLMLPIHSKAIKNTIVKSPHDCERTSNNYQHTLRIYGRGNQYFLGKPESPHHYTHS